MSKTHKFYATIALTLVFFIVHRIAVPPVQLEDFTATSVQHSDLLQVAVKAIYAALILVIWAAKGEKRD